MPKLPKASFPTTKKIWLNGKFTNWDSAQTHLLTHALHYGSSAFEGIRFYATERGPAVFRLKEHVKRFFVSAKALNLKIPFSPKEVTAGILQTVKLNKIQSGYLRPITFFGYGRMGLSPTGSEIQVAIACWPWQSYLGGKPIKVKTSRFTRLDPRSIVVEAKIGGYYVNSILASLEARKAGYEEALLLDTRGYVAEGPGENIFFVKKGILHTPELGSILPGITRASIQTIAKNLNIKGREGKYKLKDLYAADELFFTGTAAEIQPIGSLDGKKINSGKIGPLTQQLRKIYLEAAQGKVKQYQKWLSFI